jgi:hypothetical protein
MVEGEYLIHIPYETRNLGLPSFSLSEAFLENPDEELLKTIIADKASKLKRFFIQVRIAKVNLSIAPVLQRCGFYFVESILKPQTNLSNNIILNNFIDDRSSFIPGKYPEKTLKVHNLARNDKVTRARLKEIAEHSFSDDRFHIDLNCPDSIANRRFSNWVDDLYKDEGVDFYYLEYSGKAIAFMCHKNQNLILAGFEKQYVNSGLGDFFWLSVLETMLQRGICQVKTLIAVNNISVLNLYSRLGFKFKHPSVTFHYWSN